MKLYFSPGACSLSPHIVFREAGLAVELVKVNTKEGKTATGADYRAINAKGAVPALQLDDGQVLTEGAAIVQYLADLAPSAKLAPANGTLERYQLQEWLNYVGTELHKGFSPLYNRKLDDQAKAIFRAALEEKFTWVASLLSTRPYLAGQTFSVADAYLFVMLTWMQWVKIERSNWPVLESWFLKVSARPAVQAALAAEAAARL